MGVHCRVRACSPAPDPLSRREDALDDSGRLIGATVSKEVGRALLTQVIADHVERGAQLFYLQATEAGFPLYQRMGFQTVANPAIWVAGHSTQPGQNQE